MRQSLERAIAIFTATGKPGEDRTHGQDRRRPTANARGARDECDLRGDADLTQAEADPIRLVVYGDDMHARYETVDGYTVLYNEDVGQYCYAEKTDEGLRPTEVDRRRSAAEGAPTPAPAEGGAQHRRTRPAGADAATRLLAG